MKKNPDLIILNTDENLGLVVMERDKNIKHVLKKSSWAVTRLTAY